MIRGTTAQFKFKLPYSMDKLKWITIQFWQPGNPNLSPITKDINHCNESGPQEICVSLLASETSMFSDKFKAKVQLRAQPVDIIGGPVFGSKPQSITVYPMPDSLINKDPAIETPDAPTTEGITPFDGGIIINRW